MLSPLLGIAGVNSLLFASYGLSKRIVTPFGELSLPQIALAGAMAGAANAVLASPGNSHSPLSRDTSVLFNPDIQLKCSRFGCKVNTGLRQINV